ncbi:MAG TPA: hypothetical protein VFX59_04090, partial [Polyangiales bacterium]|nr:hypothetical protein [Polyangiales bacterium]
LFVSACAPDFTEAWETSEPRLLGARVEAADGSPRPKLGDPFSLRFGIALPSGNWPTPLASRYGFDVSLCLGFLSDNGVLTCLGEQQFTPTVTPLSDSEVLVSGLALDLSGLGALGLTPSQLVSGAALTEIDRLALFGVFCVDGDPERVPNTVAGDDPPSALYRCLPRAGASFTDATTFSLSVFFDRGIASEANRDPAFACDPAAPTSACSAGTVIAGEPQVPGTFVIAKPKPKKGTGLREVVAWPARDPASPLPWDNCAADPSLVQIRGDSGEHSLRARFDPSDREDYSYVLQVNGRPETRTGREALTLTHQVTLQAGKLNRFDSKLDSGDPDSEAEISFRWTPPEKGNDLESIPDSGRLVRFSFTLRDERGGIDFTTREVCLLPALRGG